PLKECGEVHSSISPLGAPGDDPRRHTRWSGLSAGRGLATGDVAAKVWTLNSPGQTGAARLAGGASLASRFRAGQTRRVGGGPDGSAGRQPVFPVPMHILPKP